jgi:hypothetical protein
MLVNAFTYCGMLDMLYRTFITHMEIKINMASTDELSTLPFINKINSICDYTQIMYTYPFIFDRNKEADIEDSSFKLKLYITQKIVQYLFTLYDARQYKDNLIQVEQNIINILRYQQLSPGIFPYDFEKTSKFIKPNIIDQLSVKTFSVPEQSILENVGLTKQLTESSSTLAVQQNPFQLTEQQRSGEEEGEEGLKTYQPFQLVTQPGLELIPVTPHQEPLGQLSKESIARLKVDAINTLGFNHFLNVFYNPISGQIRYQEATK